MSGMTIDRAMHILKLATVGCLMNAGGREVPIVEQLRELRAALADLYGGAEWRPIATAPRERGPMIVVRGVFADRNYVTDPWCVFWQENVWQRWPHSDPPTHWLPLPPLSIGSVA